MEDEKKILVALIESGRVLETTEDEREGFKILSDAATQIRNIAIEAIQKHEALEDGGNRCSDERCNMVAFLAHVLRLDILEFAEAYKIYLMYEKHHEQDHSKDM